MPKSATILQVAVASPLRQSLDYLPPAECNPECLVPGVRLRVPFRRAETVGVLLEVATRARIDAGRLKRAVEVIDPHPVIPPDHLDLLRWISSYYHHPLGETIFNALPSLLRQNRPAEAKGVRRWSITSSGAAVAPDALARAPKQAALLRLMQAQPQGMTAEEIHRQQTNWQATMRTLIQKGWIKVEEKAGPVEINAIASPPRPDLYPAQGEAIAAVLQVRDRFQTFLLDGVTGSGKTEVYLNIIEGVIATGRQALVLIPEIGLTPQMVQRFRQRFPVPLAVLHSGLNEQERLTAWLMARDGTAPVVVGTRSAVFTPLPNPGIIIVDEEHDLSYKQQDGLRYSARDIAIVRGQRAGIPVVLGSATPSLESLANVERDRYRRLALPKRAGNAQPPRVEVLDVRHQPMDENLSQPLLKAVARHLEQDEQVLLFLNRRGFAPTLICHDCGWVAACLRCDARLTLHQQQRRLRCHHCAAEQPVPRQCPTCGSIDLRPLGFGTERTDQAVQRHFPDVPVIRIDRDTTRRKGAMQALVEQVRAGQRQILIGTQMLAKGHDFPNVTLVGILDADQGLFGTDFRAGERMAQLVTQVTGRAGRGDKPGRVIIQTHHPDHPLLQVLLKHGYGAFAAAALQERREAYLPPYAVMALLRAEAVSASLPMNFLDEAARCIAGAPDIELAGPVPAPMERRAGRYRAQLLILSPNRAALHPFLSRWLPEIEALKSGKKVRWSLDVDPQEMI